MGAGGLLDIFFQDFFARVGERINRVSHAVNQTRAVESFFVDVFANVAHHADKFQIRAAVFHVKNQRGIQNFCFKRRVLSVGTQEAQKIFRRRKFRVGHVNIHGAAFFVVIVRVISIRREQREGRDKFEALTQGIAHAYIRSGRSLHDNIAGEVRR